jgi:hypothetical protein
VSRGWIGNKDGIENRSLGILQIITDYLQGLDERIQNVLRSSVFDFSFEDLQVTKWYEWYEFSRGLWLVCLRLYLYIGFPTS